MLIDVCTEEAAASAKQSAGIGKEQAKEKASATAQEAKQKASETAQSAHDTKEQAKGAAKAKSP